MIRSALPRKIAMGAVPSLAAAMLAVGGATAAQAATQPVDQVVGVTAAAQPMSDLADCPVNDLCWWVDANQVGKMHPVRDAVSNWTTQKEPTCPSGTWNDCASTLYNHNPSLAAWLWYNAGNGGPDFCMPPGSYLGNLTDYDYPGTTVNINDTISANSWAANCEGSPGFGSLLPTSATRERPSR
jgi:Peptidase inhibitor family I36